MVDSILTLTQQFGITWHEYISTFLKIHLNVILKHLIKKKKKFNCMISLLTINHQLLTFI